MSLSTKQATEKSGGSGIKITDGVYARIKNITKVKDLSGETIEWAGNKSFDLAIEVEFDEGFPLTLMGNLKFSGNDVEGWGGAFTIALLFEAAGVTANLNNANRFTPADLRKLIGKPIVTVSYCNGTYTKDGKSGNSYGYWNQVFSVNDNEQALINQILDAWEYSRKNGYPSNYQYPSATGSGISTGSSAGTKSPAKPSNIELSEIDDMDDDLPF